MTVSSSLGDPRYSGYAGYSIGWCYIHGNYSGFNCPYCFSTYTPPKQTVTISPVSTEDAITAMVKAFDQLINDLREQVAERDRQIEDLIQQTEQLKPAPTI